MTWGNENKRNEKRPGTEAISRNWKSFPLSLHDGDFGSVYIIYESFFAIKPVCLALSLAVVLV